MDLGVAVCASPVKVPYRIGESRCGGMTARDMAGVAYPGHAYLEQLRIISSVRLVAIGAILHYGRVFPKVRTASLRMTTQAVLCCRGVDELLGVGTAVWIMTTRAGDFPLAVGHVRRALKLCAPHLVTREAQFRLLLSGAANVV